MEYLFNGLLMKRLRLNKNMTLQQLADYAKSAKSYIWELEQGRIDPSGSKLIAISQVLGCKIEHLYYENKSSHKWDRDGERCIVCGDKDWMGGECNG